MKLTIDKTQSKDLGDSHACSAGMVEVEEDELLYHFEEKVDRKIADRKNDRVVG